MRAIIVVITLLLSSPAVFADFESGLDAAVQQFREEAVSGDTWAALLADNVSEEYITCTAFFIMLSNGSRASGEGDLADKFEKFSTTMAGMGLQAAMISRTSEMAQKVTQTRLRLNVDQMKDSIDHNHSNVSILLDKYNQRCIWIYQNPDALIDEWAQKIWKRYNESQREKI